MSLSLCTATPSNSLLREGGSCTQALCHLVEVSVRVGLSSGASTFGKASP